MTPDCSANVFSWASVQPSPSVAGWFGKIVSWNSWNLPASAAQKAALAARVELSLRRLSSRKFFTW